MLSRCLLSLILALALAAPQFAGARAAAPLSHIYVIMMENTNYEDVVGNTADAPYINSLINTYSFAANYYGVTHPSVPNYLAATAGDFFGLHADDVTKRFTATNIVDQLEAKGLTWATYQQGLPAVGSTVDQAPATGSGLYVKKHNPFALYSDVLSSPSRVQNFKPIESLATDLAAGNAPNFAFIVPDQCHDMHGVSPPSATNYGLPWCGYPPDFVVSHPLVQAGDAYIKSLVTTIMSSKAWTADSAIVLTWDENESSGRGLTSANRGYSSSTGCCASPAGDGGGRVPTVVITNTPSHTISLRPYNHYSLLRTIEDNFGLSCLANTCDPSVHAMTDLLTGAGTSIPVALTQGFAVTFSSTVPGQGWVLFGPGPDCSGLVETATNDVGAGTTTHTVLVTGNDMPGSIGNIGLSPGVTYSYEAVTLGTDGKLQIDDNGGKCYQVTVSSSS